MKLILRNCVLVCFGRSTEQQGLWQQRDCLLSKWPNLPPWWSHIFFISNVASLCSFICSFELSVSLSSMGCWFVPSLARQHSKLFLNPCCFPFSSVFSASCCFLILYNPGWDLRLQDQPFPWFIQLVVMLAGLVGWLCSNLLLAHLFLLTFVFSVCCCLLQFHLGRVVPETLLWLSSTFRMMSFHR